MSHRIDRPVGQKLLTNIAVVRLRREGKRFEIACYPNKVVNWRDKVETDINEVLQMTVVYENVSRGILAKSADLEKAFGTTDLLRCCMVILEHGELQEGEKERKVKFESLFRDVVTMVSAMCVNPETGLPHPPSVIETALHSIHFAVNPAKPAKAQALGAVHELQTKSKLPIVRAAMRLRILVPPDMIAELDAALHSLDHLQYSEVDAASSTASSAPALAVRDAVCDPKHFRTLEELVSDLNSRTSLGLAGYIDILEHAVRTSDSSSSSSSSSHSSSHSSSASGGGAAAGGGAAPRRGRSGEDVSFENKVVKPPTWAAEAAKEASGGAAAAPTDAAGAGGGGGGGGGAAADSAIGCRSCRISLPSRAAVRDHMSTPWHRVNLKRKVKGEAPLSLVEFEALTPAAVSAALDETL